jgi:hypothetical protein
MSIALHIERLIVDGLPLTPAQARALRAGIETHLAQMLEAAPLTTAAGYALPALSATPIVWSGAATAHDGARQVAASLHAALHGAAPAGRGVAAPAGAPVAERRHG